MEDLDLDTFIANIELLAPQEEQNEKLHKCRQCDTVLECLEGSYICPSCNAQATDILQTEETELHFDESGRPMLGQRVNLRERARKHAVDYGWAWSTDEAIVHILDLQLAALERLRLVPEFFRRAVTEMWQKYWLDNIAPFIKEEYNSSDFIQIKTSRALKLRDVEVLVRVKDKVLIPQRLAKKCSAEERNSYRMLDQKFFNRNFSLDELELDEWSAAEEVDLNSPTISHELAPLNLNQANEDEMLIEQDHVAPMTSPEQPLEDYQATELTRNRTLENISILTLNRSLAFIEAAARCMADQFVQPLFASDIVRLCNQRVIPFFGAHKTLPDGMNLNNRDKLMFQKNKPPLPMHLTRTASLLIRKLYNDKLPLYIPVPSLDKILSRFVVDLNLPHDLLNQIGNQVSFQSLRYTRPIEFHNRFRKTTTPPQYDRWAFAILICQLKRLFSLDCESLKGQAQLAQNESNRTRENYFVMQEWSEQMCLRLKCVTTYDPFALFHPMTNIKDIRLSNQLRKYIELLFDDRASSSTRSRPNLHRFEHVYRIEFAEFLEREICQLDELSGDMADQRANRLDKPGDPMRPIQEALERTRKLWYPKVLHNRDVCELIDKDFTFHKVLTLPLTKTWAIYGDGCPGNMKLELQPDWPAAFLLLMQVGAYMCYCEPRDLLRQVKMVEEFMYPMSRVMKRRQQARSNSLDLESNKAGVI